MLTGDLVKPRLRARAGKLQIKMLSERDAAAQQTAADLTKLFREHTGAPQGALDDALEVYEGDRLDYIVIRGLAKVLRDGAVFTPVETPIAPDELRAALFGHGPAFERPDLFHPRARDEIVRTAAMEIDAAPEQIERWLYADRPAEYLMTDPGPDWQPVDLIGRYNLELARAALYWCDGMQVDIYDTFKDFWRYMKLFKLMFWATPIKGQEEERERGYHVALDGPISPFVKSTKRYGRQFAAFLPALFLCKQWRMTASVQPPGFDEKLVYELDPTSPLRSHFKRSAEYDSRLEASFAAEFYDKFGDARGQWALSRHDEVILLGDTVMIPDFAVTHKKDGRRALIEIMGFWHPQYLQRKLAKVRAANRRDLILLVYEGVNLTGARLERIPNEVLYFKNKPVLKDVMAAVERAAM
ncbi:MAG: DUF790 family protein [Anaerolineae bacterium]|nr:DUF790 family protein [Anaerolineae bacterium]